MKAIYPGQPSYSLGKVYKSVFGEELKDAHDASADVSAVARLLLATNKHTLGSLDRLVEAHSESIGHIQKRCQKGR